MNIRLASINGNCFYYGFTFMPFTFNRKY